MSKAVWGKDFPNIPSNVGWMDFIHKWRVLPYKENPFITYTEINKEDPNRLLILNGYFKSVASNDVIYPATECYFMRETENHGWSNALKFVVYVDNYRGIARIECFDTESVSQCVAFAREMEIVTC